MSVQLTLNSPEEAAVLISLLAEYGSELGEEYAPTCDKLKKRLESCLKSLKKEQKFTIEMMEAMGLFDTPKGS